MFGRRKAPAKCREVSSTLPRISGEGLGMGANIPAAEGAARCGHHRSDPTGHHCLPAGGAGRWGDDLVRKAKLTTDLLPAIRRATRANRSW